MIFHRHQWKVVSSQRGEYKVIGGVATVILYHCAGCGKNKTETLNGHWSPGQLEGRSVS